MQFDGDALNCARLATGVDAFDLGEGSWTVRRGVYEMMRAVGKMT